MKRIAWQVGAAALVLMGLCAGLLARSQHLFSVGEPALRIIPEPLMNTDGEVATTNQVYLPEQVLTYSSRPQPVTPLEQGWLPPDTTYGRRRYVTPQGAWLDLSVVLMGKDRTSIHKPEYCLPGQGFEIQSGLTQFTEIEIPGSPAYRLPVARLIATKKVRQPDGSEAVVRAVFVYWFVAEGQLTANHVTRMLKSGWEMITEGRMQRWAYVSCLALCHPGQEEATFERIRDFLVAAVPEFQFVRKSDTSARLISPAGTGCRQGTTSAVSAEIAGDASG